jgi:hypothetical protein
MILNQRDKIVDDLLLKNPRGPKTSKPNTRASEVVEHFGYDKEDLFDFQLHSYTDVSEYIRNRFFGDIPREELGRKKATVTRRSRRLWNRLDPAVRTVKRAGDSGIYKIQESKWISYGGPMGFLHAFNQAEAQKLADMFFGYVMTSSYSQKPYVEIVERGGTDNLMKFNKKVIDNLKKTIESLERDIVNKTKNLTTLQARLNAVEALQKGQTKSDDS